MDDFLYNLRSGKLKQNDRGKRPYGSQYKNSQKKTGNYQQKRDVESKEAFERLNAIKDVLENITQTQLRMADAYKARNQAEERKARAFEVLAMSIYKMVNPEADDVESLFAPLAVEFTAEETKIGFEAAENAIEAFENLENPAESIDSSVEMAAEQSDKKKLAGNSRRKLFKIIDTLRSEGTSWVKIANEVTAQGYPTISGRGIWRGTMIKNFYEKMGVER